MLDSAVNCKKSYLNIPLHLKYVATLPCEEYMFKNRHAQEVKEDLATEKTVLKYLSGKISIYLIQ